MNEFEKKLDKILCNGVTVSDEKFYLYSNLVGFFNDWQPPKPLVVVPQIVADFIEVRKKELKLHGAFHEIEECYGAELYDWVFKKSNGQDLFARAWFDGYTVEKEKLYLLKHIDISSRDTAINYYLTHTFTAPFIGHTNFSKGYDMSDVKDCHFIINYSNNLKKARKANVKKVAKFDTDGKLIKKYESITEAARDNRVSGASISNCLLGKHKTSCGFLWKYQNNEVNP